MSAIDEINTLLDEGNATLDQLESGQVMLNQSIVDETAQVTAALAQIPDSAGLEAIKSRLVSSNARIKAAADAQTAVAAAISAIDPA